MCEKCDEDEIEDCKLVSFKFFLTCIWYSVIILIWMRQYCIDYFEYSRMFNLHNINTEHKINHF